jgi:environmental stress-induced protein Ves
LTAETGHHPKARVQIIRQSSFKAIPWKNGGGVTHEALRVPADGPEFRWRVSIATIAASGPFSDFSGYRRHLTLLRGAGMQLQFADGTEANLSEDGAHVAFDGGLAAHCELLAGPCTDLNLMVSAALPAPRVRVQSLVSELTLEAAPRALLLVFAIAGAVVIAGPGAAADAGGGREILAPWDLALSMGMGSGTGTSTATADGPIRLSSVDELHPAQVFIANLLDTGS